MFGCCIVETSTVLLYAEYTANYESMSTDIVFEDYHKVL